MAEDIGNAIQEAQFELNIQDAQKRLDYGDAYGHAALKSLVLVNGGAILSLLTFLGNTQIQAHKLGIFWAFVWFSLGLAAILVAHFGAYFSQNFYMRALTLAAWKAKFDAHQIPSEVDHNSDERRGNLALTFAIGGAVLSFVFFVIGTFVALYAIT